MQELIERHEKTNPNLFFSGSMFTCFVCETAFDECNLEIHHDDDLNRGKGRGRLDRLTEWRRQLRSKNCCLMILCPVCHKKRHRTLKIIGARK